MKNTTTKPLMRCKIWRLWGFQGASNHWVLRSVWQRWGRYSIWCDGRGQRLWRRGQSSLLIIWHRCSLWERHVNPQTSFHRFPGFRRTACCRWARFGLHIPLLLLLLWVQTSATHIMETKGEGLCTAALHSCCASANSRAFSTQSLLLLLSTIFLEVCVIMDVLMCDALGWRRVEGGGWGSCVWVFAGILPVHSATYDSYSGIIIDNRKCDGSMEASSLRVIEFFVEISKAWEMMSDEVWSLELRKKESFKV